MKRLEANAPQMQVFDMSQGISLIRDEGHTHEGHVHAGGVEPHVWNSPTNARIIARNVCDALCRLDSLNAPFYTARLDSLNGVIDRTDSIVRSILADAASHTFLIYHPALSYFARDYGLTQLCWRKEARSPRRPPANAHPHLPRKGRAHRVRAERVRQPQCRAGGQGDRCTPRQHQPAQLPLGRRTHPHGGAIDN